MPRIKFAGPLGLRLSSAAALNAITLSTYARRSVGRKMEPTWDADLEIGVRFWRRQFTKAMRCEDISRGRLLLDSLQTETSDVYEVDEEETVEPAGHWYLPRKRATEATILYFHGGGYAFYGAMSRRFGAMLAHRIGAPVFAPNYRLTPEHASPAQADDAMAAWGFMAEALPPKNIVVIGDSAGAHMALMLLQELKEIERPQPAGAIALSPWTDIGDSCAHLHANDRYDLVQGWMAVQFGRWLNPDGKVDPATLSPAMRNFNDCAPIYLQAGGREIFHQTSIEFARTQIGNGAEVMLDVWPTMPHDFQLFDSTQKASSEALKRIADAVRAFATETAPLTPIDKTVARGAV